MLPAALTALILGSQVEPTHAIGGARKGTEGLSISALHTRDALRTDTKVLHTGQLVAGDQVQAQVLVRNVWDRQLSLEVSLSGLPSWQATLESPVLKPGETTLLHLTGIAGEPGELNGKVRITALHDFLKLQVSVQGQIAPRPEPVPDPATHPDVPTVEIGLMPNEGPPVPEPDPPAPESAPGMSPAQPAPAVEIELMPRAPQSGRSSGEG